MTLNRLRNWLERFKTKADRDAFTEAQIEELIPFQIRAMRKREGWSQKDLAARAGMTQARISVLENPNYEGAVNIKTLVKLASALDVSLIVRFAPFSEVIDWTHNLSKKNHEVPTFPADIAASVADASQEDYLGAAAPTLVGTVQSVVTINTNGSAKILNYGRPPVAA